MKKIIKIRSETSEIQNEQIICPEENGYALVEVYPSGAISVTGYRKAASAKI